METSSSAVLFPSEMSDDEAPELIGEDAAPADEAPQLVEASDSGEKPEPTKVSIITGFLGAGKTTLLSYILTENHGLRIAIIENEFGAGTCDLHGLFVAMSHYGYSNWNRICYPFRGKELFNGRHL
jgi:hypothetical protein